MRDREVWPTVGPAIRILTLLILAVLVASCWLLGDDFPEGLTVDNRTTQRVTVYGLIGPPSDRVESLLGDVPPGVTVALGIHGCYPNGMEARAPDGDVVATLPPVDLESETGCEYTWVVTRSESYIDTNAAPAPQPG